MKKGLTVELLKSEAAVFSAKERSHAEPSLFGVTDGKAVGTYLEHKFQDYLRGKYDYVAGSSAKGIDFPELSVDIKVTSVKQPQSSCPYKSARQKVYGLGYSLLVFVYDKSDDEKARSARLDIRHVIFVESEKTGDFQTTAGLQKVIANEGNVEDIVAFLVERFLPVDEIQANELAQEILTHPPDIGYLTISNALQWRLQYARVIERAGQVEGLQRLL